MKQEKWNSSGDWFLELARGGGLTVLPRSPAMVRRHLCCRWSVRPFWPDKNVRTIKFPLYWTLNIFREYCISKKIIVLKFDLILERWKLLYWCPMNFIIDVKCIQIYFSCQVEGLYCYLLDENGYVVASNKDDEVR